MRSASLVLALLAALLVAAPAGAQDPARWILTGTDRVSSDYYQGLAHDAGGSIFFTGPVRGAYRTNAELVRRRSLTSAIPPELARSPGFNHVGDPGWLGPAAALVLPLECYSLGAPNGGNTCGRGAFALLGAGLGWRGYYLLDPAEIAKAMWAEVSPDGALIWTSSGRDLLAYRTADLVPAHAAPLGTPLRAAIRLPGAAPAGGITGAAFLDGRLFLAGQGSGPFQIWSLDVAAAAAGGALDPRLEIQRDIVGESEGLDAFTGRGGVLHWLVTPLTFSGRRPTYPGSGNTLLTFAPAGATALRATTPRRELRAGRPARIVVHVTQTLGGRTVPAARALVRAGSARALTGADGDAELRVRPLRSGVLALQVALGELVAPGLSLPVQPSIGRPLSGPPSALVSAGRGSRRVRASVLLDCSGAGGCEDASVRRPRECVAARPGADIRVRLLRRPAGSVSMRIAAGGRTVDAGRAISTGRSALGWRLDPRRPIPARATLTIVAVYPGAVGALTVVRLRTGGC